MAHQPELLPNIQVSMLIAATLVKGVVLFTQVIGFMQVQAMK